MKPPTWLADTIARRFAVTEVLVVAVTVALALLFNRFGGVWALEPVEQTGLLDEVADLVRTVVVALTLENALDLGLLVRSIY